MDDVSGLAHYELYWAIKEGGDPEGLGIAAGHPQTAPRSGGRGHQPTLRERWMALQAERPSFGVRRPSGQTVTRLPVWSGV